MKKLTLAELITAQANFSKTNQAEFVEIFKSPRLYKSDEEVQKKIDAVISSHPGWVTLLSGYLEEDNGMKRAVILHYKP